MTQVNMTVGRGELALVKVEKMWKRVEKICKRAENVEKYRKMWGNEKIRKNVGKMWKKCGIKHNKNEE